MVEICGRQYSDEQRKQPVETFTAKAVLMKDDLRAAGYQSGNFYVVFGSALVTLIYWLIIWYFHNY